MKNYNKHTKTICRNIKKNRQKFMDKLERTIDKLDKKAANIANKWQDKAKEPTQKSFEENLHRFEKEAEMENQNINPQRTQSQER